MVDGSNETLKANSIDENCWVRFQGDLVFTVQGSGSRDFIFTHLDGDDSVAFDPQAPVNWGAGGQPSWLSILSGATADSFTIQDNGAQTGTKTFTINNAAAGGGAFSIQFDNIGGTGGQQGGTLYCYLKNDNGVLVGTLPEGVFLTGTGVTFGFCAQGELTIQLMAASGTVLQGTSWNPSMPAYIDVDESASQITITDTNTASELQSAEFTIATNLNAIDPTIVNNPDENPP
jgi:hypothetical protein